MFTNNFFPDREAWDSQIKENSARFAWAWGTVASHGWGEFSVEDPIMFGVTFVHQPMIFYGHLLLDDEQLVDGRYPRVSGGVSRWVQDSGDFYIGAYVYITVATADPLLAAQSLDVATDFALDPGYDVEHHFTFFAMSIKGALGSAAAQDS